MGNQASVLSELSKGLESRLTEAKSVAVAIRSATRNHQNHVTGLLWEAEAVVTSEQAFGDDEQYEVVTAEGDSTRARIVGRDSGTNLLVLRPERTIGSAPRATAVPRAGALALAFGADFTGTLSARLGVINKVGPQWYSRVGGRIEQRIGLDIRLVRTEEGGPVLDANGCLLGMSTLGPPGEVLVIPSATIERIVPQLLRDGRVKQGWLGLGLQPVALPEAWRESAGQSMGIMVMSSIEGGPAANAGIVAGDILLTLNGASLQSIGRLAARLDEESVGRTIALRLIRGGEVLSLQTLVAARP